MYLLILEVPAALRREKLRPTDLSAGWQRLSQPVPTAVLGHEWRVARWLCGSRPLS